MSHPARAVLDAVWPCAWFAASQRLRAVLVRKIGARSSLSIVLLVLAVVLTACGSHKGYPGPVRSFKAVAIVVGGQAAGGWFDSDQFVYITAINGRDEHEDWSGGKVHLLPGTYEFDVQYGRVADPSPLAGPLLVLGALAVDATHAAEDRSTLRRIRFTVAAGRTYVIHYDPEKHEYSVSDLYSAVAEPPAPAFKAPPSAAPCVPDPPDDSEQKCFLIPLATTGASESVESDSR